MKNKFLTFILLSLMMIGLTACSESKITKQETKIHSMLGLSENYIWISEDGINYNLVDLNGNVIYKLESGYTPASKVVEKYFFVINNESEKIHLYNLSGEELFADGDKIELKSAYKGDKFTNDYVYAVSVWNKDESIEENKNDIKVYILNDELTDITDDYVSGNYAITDMYHLNSSDGFNRPDLLFNPTGNKFYEYYLKIDNGNFSLVKNGYELYKNISDEVILDNCGSYNVIAKIEGKYYIISEEGAKKEIEYIKQGYKVNEYCSGYITASAKFTNGSNETKLYNSSGEEINLIKE